MNSIVRNILAVLIGLALGVIVNGFLISVSGSIIPLPDAVDPNDMESIKANMHLYEPIHFLMPFLAHALGTLVGAIAAVLIAANRKMTFALVIGFLFSIGGLMMVISLPSPMWFNAVDLLLAYIPIAWLGYKIASVFNKNKT